MLVIYVHWHTYASDHANVYQALYWRARMHSAWSDPLTLLTWMVHISTHEIMQCFIRQRSHNHQLITVVRPSSQHHTLEDNESTRQPPLPTLNSCAHVPLHFWCNLTLTSWVQEQRRRAWLHQCLVVHNQHNGTTLRLSTNWYPL